MKNCDENGATGLKVLDGSKQVKALVEALKKSRTERWAMFARPQSALGKGFIASFIDGLLR